MKLQRSPQPRVETVEDARLAIIEIIDALNRIVEEVNRLARLVEPID